MAEEKTTPERLAAMHKQCTFLQGVDRGCGCYSPLECQFAVLVGGCWEPIAGCTKAKWEPNRS